ncbi:hypothetical protein SALB1_3165 [Salinisphaera sp. LB1]|nr:hypothetical protein SALB1_3165 [Salinisphaera sp. LB1]
MNEATIVIDRGGGILIQVKAPHSGAPTPPACGSARVRVVRLLAVAA